MTDRSPAYKCSREVDGKQRCDVAYKINYLKYIKADNMFITEAQSTKTFIIIIQLNHWPKLTNDASIVNLQCIVKYMVEFLGCAN